MTGPLCKSFVLKSFIYKGEITLRNIPSWLNSFLAALWIALQNAGWDEEDFEKSRFCSHSHSSLTPYKDNAWITMQSFNFGTLFKIVVESLSSLSSATHKFSILNFYFSFENTDSVETILLLTLKTCKVITLIKLSDWSCLIWVYTHLDTLGQSRILACGKQFGILCGTKRRTDSTDTWILRKPRYRPLGSGTVLTSLYISISW